jgi:RNA recognition motif-containing protein
MLPGGFGDNATGLTRILIQVVAVRLVAGYDGKPKGYGYVEFSDLESLKSGIAKGGGQFAGRTIRVGVAEART